MDEPAGKVLPLWAADSRTIGFLRRLPLFGLLLVCALSPGCAGVQQRPAPGKGQIIEWRKKTPQEILARLRQDQEKIQSLTAAFALSFDPPPKGQPANLRGVLFFARGKQGPRIRIKGLAPFGRIAFDMVLTADLLEIYIPSQRTLYRGRPRNDGGGATIWNDTMKAMFADFTTAAVPEKAALVIQGRGVTLPLVDGEIRFDRRTALMQEWRRKSGTVFYDDYYRQEGAPPVPRRIAMKSRDGSRQARCRLRQVCVNCDTSGVFDLSEYKPETLRDLKALNRSLKE